MGRRKVEGLRQTRGGSQAEGFHHPAHLVGEFDRRSYKPSAGRNQSSQQHAVEAFDPDFPIEADLCQVSEAIRIVGVRFIGCHIKRGFGVTRIDADGR